MLYDGMTVGEIGWSAAGFHPDVHGLTSSYQCRYTELTQGFELPVNKKIKTLSKGMRAKLSLYLALAADPSLLILDEPTSGLDVLVIAHMLRVQGLLVIPTGLLVVSWAWSGYWLLDRSGFGRWLRLALLLTAMFTLAASWYAAYRAWGFREVSPIAPPTVWNQVPSTRLLVDQIAAELYQEATRQLAGPAEDSPEFH
jgi:hypothetical protein